jgi:hypothetical protein
MHDGRTIRIAFPNRLRRLRRSSRQSADGVGEVGFSPDLQRETSGFHPTDVTAISVFIFVHGCQSSARQGPPLAAGTGRLALSP